MSNSSLYNLMSTDLFFKCKFNYEYCELYNIYCITLCLVDSEIEQKSHPDNILLRIKIYTKFKGL